MLSGGMVNGMTVPNMDKYLASVQDKFVAHAENIAKSGSNESFEYVPLVNPFPDTIIKAAIYGNNQASSLKSSQETFNKAMLPYHEMMLRQYASEYPDSSSRRVQQSYIHRIKHDAHCCRSGCNFTV